jgi:adenine-specific DNA-methyltransferase
MDCPVFIVSYSEDGLLDLSSLRGLLEEFGTVTLQRFTHKRFKSNDSQLHPELEEYLLILRKTA